MKYVLIGGDGFLGRHLARELLLQGEEVQIFDIRKSELGIYEKVPFFHLDVTDRSNFSALSVEPEDVVCHLAARLLMPIVPRRTRKEFFFSVNFGGTKNLLEYLFERDCGKFVYFTTDMVYGHTKSIPRYEDHPREPIGPYGGSKLASEKLCESYRQRGMNITIFRPRVIIGSGRLGIFKKLFDLVDAGLPVPVIGNGSNHYQFISVFDCVSAVLCAVNKGIPNSEYNLGSIDPPTVKELISTLIKEAGSRSFILKTPAWLVKRVLATFDVLGIRLMDPEQFNIANEDCILDVSKAERELGWRPHHKDTDMLLSAYQAYRNLSKVG